MFKISSKIKNKDRVIVNELEKFTNNTKKIYFDKTYIQSSSKAFDKNNFNQQ